MGVYKIFPSKDTTIYTDSNVLNSGLDAILELSKRTPEQFASSSTSRILIQFDNNDISDAISAAITLKFSGWAIAMPFKRPAVELLDNLDVSVLKCNAVNTVVFNH
jgi:hypothetical protein